MVNIEPLPRSGLGFNISAMDPIPMTHPWDERYIYLHESHTNQLVNHSWIGKYTIHGMVWNLIFLNGCLSFVCLVVETK